MSQNGQPHFKNLAANAARFKPFECQGRMYTSFNGHLRDHKYFPRTTTGVYTRPLVVRIMNTWSLRMLHRDVYIRPWLLMPKQRGIQRL